jgi:hypothetical protein
VGRKNIERGRVEDVVGGWMHMHGSHAHIFRPPLDQKDPKIFAQYPSHRIFGRMHEALNVGKKITNCIVCL